MDQERDLFAEAAAAVSADLESQQAVRDEEVLQRWEEESSNASLFGGEPTFLDRGMDAIGLGAAKAGFETYDFIFGEPAEGDKTQTRREVEAHDRALRRRSAGYGLASGISQIAVGLIGAGKIMAPVRVGGKVAKGAWEIGRGMVAGSIVIDPHEERLSDLIETYPALQNPVSQYLQSDPTDTDAEGRLKNALESLGLDLGVVGTLALVAKAVRMGKAGDEAGVRSIIDELEAHQRKQEEAFGLPGEKHQIDANEALNDPGMAAAQAKNVEAFGLPTDMAPGKMTDDLAVAPVAAQGASPVGVESPSAAESQIAPAGTPEPPVPEGMVRVYHSGAAGEGETGRWVSTSRKYASDYRPDLPLYYLDLPKDDPRVRNADWPDQGVEQGFTFNFETTPEEASRLVEVSRQSASAAPPTAPAASGELVQGGKVRGAKIPAPEFDLEALAKSVSDDIEAVTRYGSREDAIAAGHKFSPEARLPWQKLGAPEERRAFVQAVVEQGQKYFDAKKGGDVMSDARVQRMVGQIAEVFNEDPAAIAGMLSQAGDQARTMVARMEGSFLIGQKMFQDAYELQVRIENGILDEWGGDLAAAQGELKNRLMAAMELTSAGNSILANAGRSLRRARSDFRLKAEDIAAIQGLDAQTVGTLVSATKGDPKKLVRIAEPGRLAKLTEGSVSLLANNLLWLYPTHVINVTTNLGMMVLRPTEKLLGGVILRNSAARKQALKEYTHLVTGLSDAWSMAVDAFKSGDSVLKPHGDEFMESAGAMGRDIGAGWQKADSVAAILGNAMKAAGIVIGLPTRSLGMVDELVKQQRYRTVVQARAAVEAAERGLSGDPFRKYVADKLQTAFDAEGRAVDPAALREAQIATFQTELDYQAWVGTNGGLGAAIRNLRSNQKWPGLILPFVKTPVNVLRYAIKLTPGLNLLQKDFSMALVGKSGAEAQAHAVGQMALGSMAMGLAATLALEGKITGGGPENPQLKKAMMDDGWKPYSYVIENEDGTKTYVPIGRFDPAGMVFGMVADLVDIMVLHPERMDEAERGIGAVAIALAQNFSEKTFLLNLNQALRAVTDPGSNAVKFVGNLGANLIPGSSALRGYVNQDPYLREARTMVDHILKDMPGYSPTLPPQRDAFGEPVWRRRGLTTNQDSDLVEAEHQRIIEETGFGITKPATTRNGVDLRDLTLEDGRNAYEKLQEYSGEPGGGPSLKQALARVIRSENYQKLVDGPAEVDGTKLDALADVVARYREAAFKRLQAESPILRQALMKRKTDVRSGLLEQRAAKDPVAQLLNTLNNQ